MTVVEQKVVQFRENNDRGRRPMETKLRATRPTTARIATPVVMPKRAEFVQRKLEDNFER